MTQVPFPPDCPVYTGSHYRTRKKEITQAILTFHLINVPCCQVWENLWSAFLRKTGLGKASKYS